MLSLGNSVYHGVRHKLSSLCLCVDQLAIVFGYMSYISSLQLLMHLRFLHESKKMYLVVCIVQHSLVMD